MHMPEATATTSLPVLRAAIGQDAISVQRQSTAPIDLRAAEDAMALGLADEPVLVQYGDGPDQLRLPPAGTVTMRLLAGHIVSVRLMPQVRVLNADEAIATLREIVGSLDGAGWQHSADGTTLEELAVRLRGLKPGKESFYLGSWRSPRGDVAQLSVESTPASGWSLPGTRGRRDCMLTMAIENELAYKHFRAEMLRLRAEDGLGDITSRPVDLPKYLARVRR